MLKTANLLSKRTIGQWLRLMSIGVLVAISTSAQTVSIDYDGDVGFLQYKTYSWIECGRPENSKLNHKLVIERIEEHLAARGLRKVDLSEADLYVAYGGAIEDCVWDDCDYLGSGGCARFTDEEAILAVKLIEARTKKIIWQARTVYTLSDKAEKNQRRVDKAVQKIFKKYPPQKN